MCYASVQLIQGINYRLINNFWQTVIFYRIFAINDSPMKRLYFLLLFLPFLSIAQIPSTQWAKTVNEYFLPAGFGSFSSNSIKSIAATSDGLIGLTSGLGNGLSTSTASIGIRKIALDGKQIWRYELYRCYSDLPTFGRDVCVRTPTPIYDFITTKNDGALVFGNRFLLVNSQGLIAWEASIQKTKKAVQLIDGSFVVSDSSSNFYRISENGLQLWKQTFAGTLGFSPTADGGFITTGTTGTKKVDSNGQIQWSNATLADNVVQTQDGGFILWGSSSILKLNSTGQQTWSYSQSGINSLVVTNDNGCVVTSSLNMKKISSGGVMEWNQIRSQNMTVYPAEKDNVLILRTSFSPYNSSSQAFIEKISIKTGFGWSKMLLIGSLSDASLLYLQDGGIGVRATTFESLLSEAHVFKLMADGSGCTYKPTILSSNNCESNTVTLFGSLENSTISGGLAKIESNLVKYQWKKDGNAMIGQTSNSLTTTQAGIYSLVISQEGCLVESAPITVGQTPSPVVSADRNDICLGESVSLTATGCNSTVRWDSGLTGTQITVKPESNTTYSAICESGSCKSAKSNNYTITINPIPTAKITAPSSIICGNKTVLLTAANEGGTAPISFQWKKGTTNVGTNQNTYSANEGGDYSVLVSDSKGCSVTALPLKVVKSDPFVKIMADKTEFCKGGTATLTATTTGGIAPITYQWFNNSKNTGTNSGLINTPSSGVYSLTITDSQGCSAESNNVTITELGADIMANISAVGLTEVFAPSTVVLNAGTGLGYSYQWQKDDKNIAGATTATYEAKESGLYSVVVSRDGCSVPSASIKVTVNTPTAIHSLPQDEVRIFPNPTVQKLVIDYDLPTDNRVIFTLLNVTGQTLKIWEELGNKNRTEIIMSDYQSGMYVLKYETQQKIQSLKFVKQ